jgi:catechol 2,3-dioxygenase-like lactoylglutathione lyase family enzyme
MAPGPVEICGIHHVKLPVSDVKASSDWYRRVLGFSHEMDFVEDGRVMGVSLQVPNGGIRLALRQAPERVAALSGFDPIAWAVETKDDLEAWAIHLDREGVQHTQIIQATIGWIISFIDPDGRDIKLYTLQRP